VSDGASVATGHNRSIIAAPGSLYDMSAKYASPAT